MSEDNTSAETAPHHADSQSTVSSRVPTRAALIVVMLSLFAVEPAVAQNAVCSADNLPSMIEGFFQLTTALGIIGLVVVWQADSLIGMFSIEPEQKKGLKRHKRSSMKSAVVLVALGPLYTVAGSVMNLPLAQCIDLAPW